MKTINLLGVTAILASTILATTPVSAIDQNLEGTTSSQEIAQTTPVFSSVRARTLGEFRGFSRKLSHLMYLNQEISWPEYVGMNGQHDPAVNLSEKVTINDDITASKTEYAVLDSQIFVNNGNHIQNQDIPAFQYTADNTVTTISSQMAGIPKVIGGEITVPFSTGKMNVKAEFDYSSIDPHTVNTQLTFHTVKDSIELAPNQIYLVEWGIKREAFTGSAELDYNVYGAVPYKYVQSLLGVEGLPVGQAMKEYDRLITRFPGAADESYLDGLDLSRYAPFTSNIRNQYKNLQTTFRLERNLGKATYSVRQATELVRNTYNITGRNAEDKGEPIETKTFAIDELAK